MSEGAKRPRQAPRTGQGGQEKKGKCAKCREERKDGRKERGGEAGGNKGQGRAGLQGGEGKGWGAQDTGDSFLNHLGVCVSNKDKGGNDYSVKSMVLDCANTN